MTADETRAINEAIFAKLEQPTAVHPESANETNSYLRSQMYLRFTGMPRRGFFRLILPPVPVKTREEWLAMGVPEADLREHHVIYTEDGPTTRRDAVGVCPWWEKGDLFYEIAENRLSREDYERRLAARTVDKWEWRSREQSRRRMAKLEREKYTPGVIAKHEAFAYTVMGEIAGTTLALAERNDSGRNHDQADQAQ